MSEQLLMQKIRGVLSHPDASTRVWRNNTGVLKDDRGIPVRFGLAVGSADLIGIAGPMGRFLAVEVKTPTGRLSKEQIAWLATVERHGGIAVVARSVEGAHELLRRIESGEDLRSLRGW